MATDPRRARELTGVEAIPTEALGCVTQYYALPGDVDLATGGRLLLNAAGAEPNQVADLTAVAPEYGSDGRQLLSATFLDPEAGDDGALAARTREALASWYPEQDFGGLEVVATDRIP
ncbi:MAG: phytoene dehydrogenase, partial [Actinobacteria bacterium]|nr:phytoene dehydrogenase [Actinomycetota bacterium]